MSNIKIKIKNEEQMIELGYILTGYAYPNLVLALTGDLGAGKTTFTKGIGKRLGIKRVINSPTFVVMKIYDALNQVNGIEKLYHLDVYRLTDASGDFELEEYFEMNGLTIIEWADIIKDILPKNLWRMNIQDLGNNKRCVDISFDLNSESLKDLEKELKEANYELIN